MRKIGMKDELESVSITNFKIRLIKIHMSSKVIYTSN